MIEISHVILPSPEQIEFIIEGMRNPLNSWDKTDSIHCTDFYCDKCPYDNDSTNCAKINPDDLIIGKNDLSLMNKLAKAGTDHRKFMRMLPVFVRINAPLYWWKEFDTYKVGTVANSCSTMHKIQAKEFTLADFSCEHLDEHTTYVGLLPIVNLLNANRERFIETKDKKYWWQMIQLLPSSYNQIRNVSLNYEVLANMYRSRRNHKLDEWREFCKWVEALPYSELITGVEDENKV